MEELLTETSEGCDDGRAIGELVLDSTAGQMEDGVIFLRAGNTFFVRTQKKQVQSAPNDFKAGHDHIPASIFLSPHQARLFGQCSISYDQWLKILIDKQIIDE